VPRDPHGFFAGRRIVALAMRSQLEWCGRGAGERPDGVAVDVLMWCARDEGVRWRWGLETQALAIWAGEFLGEIRGPKYEEVDECDLSAIKSRRGVVLAGVLRMLTLKWFGDDEC